MIKTRNFISFLLTVVIMTSSAVFAASPVTLTQSDGQQINYYPSKTFWDLSIDSSYSIYGTSNIRDDGDTLMLSNNLKEFSDRGNMGSDYLTLNMGNTNLNRGTIANYATDPHIANEDHDYFIKLETTSASEVIDGVTKYGYNYEVQMNQLPIRANSGVVVVQNDFAVGTLPTGSNYIRVSTLHVNDGSTDSYNTNPFTPTISVYANGVIKAGDKKTSLSIAENEWHTATQVVDFDQKTVTYYLDGNYVTMQSNQNIGAIWKFTAYHPKTGTEDLVSYYDNIKVMRVTENCVGIEATDNAATNVEGAPVTLTGLKINGSDIADIKIMSSKDGINYSLFSEETTAVTHYKDYATYYKTVGYDSYGNVISESEPIKLVTAMSKDNGTSYWDVDFNSENYSLKSSRLAYNGEHAKSSNGYTFTTNAGSSKAKVEIRNASNALAVQNGRSIVLDNSLNTEASSSTAAQTQINELTINSTDKILVVEYDFAYDKAPDKTSNVVGRLEGSYAHTDEGRYFDNSTVIDLNPSGKLFLAALGESSGINTSPDTWYHIRQVINLKEQKTDTYIDDAYTATLDFNAGKNWTKIRRFSATTNAVKNADNTYSGNNNILFYDNFKIYSVDQKEIPLFDIKKVNYFIDGQAVQRISDGNLTAVMTISNKSTTPCDANCVVAVYTESGNLKKVSIVPVSFDENENSKDINLDFGEVSATDTAKIFLWNN